MYVFTATNLLLAIAQYIYDVLFYCFKSCYQDEFLDQLQRPSMAWGRAGAERRSSAYLCYDDSKVLILLNFTGFYRGLP